MPVDPAGSAARRVYPDASRELRFIKDRLLNEHYLATMIFSKMALRKPVVDR
jgi:hypothetical protein